MLDSPWFWLSLAVVLTSAYYPMLWCRMLCPTGAVLDGVAAGSPGPDGEQVPGRQSRPWRRHDRVDDVTRQAADTCARALHKAPRRSHDANHWSPCSDRDRQRWRSRGLPAEAADPASDGRARAPHKIGVLLVNHGSRQKAWRDMLLDVEKPG